VRIGAKLVDEGIVAEAAVRIHNSHDLIEDEIQLHLNHVLPPREIDNVIGLSTGEPL